MNKSTEATPEDANHSLARRIGDEPQQFWDKVYGVMRQRLTFTKVMERLKFGEKRGSAHDPKHTSSSETQWR